MVLSDGGIYTNNSIIYAYLFIAHPRNSLRKRNYNSQLMQIFVVLDDDNRQ